MKIEKVDIFGRQVSFFRQITSTEPIKQVNIADMVLSDDYKSRVEECKKDISNKRLLPCFTPSGIFSTRKTENLVQHSGIICIDIDEKDNLNVENFFDLKNLINHIPYVAYCGHSCGGKGYFLLIPIKYPGKHKAHFQALYEDFERCEIKIDRSCSDVSRLRCVSFDEEPYVNKEAVVYTRLVEEIKYVKKKVMT